jgi:hypothetical protein
VIPYTDRFSQAAGLVRTAVYERKEGFMTLLLYDRQAGQCELYALDAQANLSLLKSYSGWRTSWTQFTPIYSSQDGTGPNQNSLLFYDSTSGTGQFFSVDTQDNLTASSPQTWSRGWTDVIDGYFLSVTPKDGEFQLLESLLFYNRESGLAQFYEVDGSGLGRQVSSTTWSTGWTHIIAGAFSFRPYTELFFYNSTNGVAQFYTMDGNGGIQQLSNTTWSTGWTHIVPVQLYLEAPQSLLFYNSTNGVAQFYKQDTHGNISQVSNATWSTGWTHIVRVYGLAQYPMMSSLLFYNQHSGAAEFYNVDSNGNIQRVSSPTTWRKSWAFISADPFS